MTTPRTRQSTERIMFIWRDERERRVYSEASYDVAVYRAARALHDWQSGPDTLDWDREDQAHRDELLDAARTMLEAIR